MLLQNKRTRNLVEVIDLQSLTDPNDSRILIQIQAGEEEQDPEPMKKKNLNFPSGEDLPICWLDVNYTKS
ncbi:acetyltransferase [Cyanobacterium sp. IPPAS B-1200]|uniref:acetyltransferase n=1 Tax=Cyanobacterium sp. IPPAS B-1200 TaxID=1562720 RepID=UPI0008526045|nr:acetyltransferase [Cyanobacterium sp. IPPAS B-1200]OEJ79956.1 acetyltransferase [Cyanobacterium sp. IPPAS B-1200]